MSANRLVSFGLLAACAFLCTVCSSSSATPVSAPRPTPSRVVPRSDQEASHGGMLRYPDVSATHIAFVYADDLWLVPREGGLATPLASPPGSEGLPRFSPDGTTIAFIGNYDGNRDLYTLPVSGGVPTRVTHHPSGEVLCGWLGEGELLFFTNGLAGRDRQVQLFRVPAAGGLPQRLPVPYGAFADVSPVDNEAGGRWLAYTPHTADNRTWKRYRGGMATDVWLFDLQTHESKRATEWEGTDTAPMWQGERLYYLSDDGPSHRLNLWTLDPATLERRQLTQYADFDVKWPAIGPGPQGTGEIVFQHGAELLLYDIASGDAHEVRVSIPGARAKLRPRTVDASKFVQNWELSPSGKRVLVSARGDVWSLPAKEGSPRNLTRTSGVAERDPLWSPDGKWLAWLSDESGEYEVVLAPADGPSAPAGAERGPKTLTRGANAFRRLLCWSPDSRFVAFCDKTGTLYLQPIPEGETRTVVKDTWQGDLWSTPPSFSRDGRFLAAAISDETTGVNRIAIHELESGTTRIVTSGMFDDSLPTFDRDGDYLYFRRRAHFEPLYGELDTTFLYAGTEMVCLVPLRSDEPSPFAPESDEEGEDDEDEDKDKDKDKEKKKDDGEKGEEKKDGDAQPADAQEKEDETDEKDEKDEEQDEKPSEPVRIDFDGFERRAVLLPIDPGNFRTLAVNDEGALIYGRAPIQGLEDEPAIHLFDVSADEPEEKLVAKEAGPFTLSADGKKLLVLKEGGPEIGEARAEAELEKVSTAGMEVEIDPRAEWRQLFTDAWRLMRDFFYDPHMHGVDWPALREQYGAMLADCGSRDDVSFVIKELISELNVGHAYYSGGDVGEEPSRGVGLLGCDFALDQGAYRIARIHEGAPWDADARGPLSQPGIDVREGEYLLAVNGVPLSAAADPWKVVPGPGRQDRDPDREREAGAGRYGSHGGGEDHSQRARGALPRVDRGASCLRRAEDRRPRGLPLRPLDGHRRPERSRAPAPRPAAQGGADHRRALELRRPIPTRFIELLNRPITNYFARRDGRDWPWPPDAHQGPKCMLINGLSGSGGDAFPWYFRQAGLGQLIGTRTWGGLVGLSGYPPLIDGGDIECPSFAFYESDGTWGVEGHGVDPDIEVLDDPALMVDGGDPQLDRAIELMLEELEDSPYVAPARPAYPDRTGMGLETKDR